MTAERRAENLQETPIAVTALSGADLTQRNATDLSDIGKFVPNLEFNTGTESSRASFVSAVYIRGIGQSDFIVTTDPGVGTYLDGVYYGRATGGVLDLLDIERVEVLRGPQGTLFGKNTIGGALNVVSVPVGKKLGGTAELTTGSFNRVNFRGDLNVPLGDTLFGRLAVSTKSSRGIGDRFDFTSGQRIGAESADHSLSARARLRWLPGDAFEGNFSFDYTHVREPQVADHLKDFNPQAPLLGLWNALVGAPQGTPYTDAYFSSNDYSSYATGPNTANLDLWGPSLHLEWKLGDYTVRWISAFRKMRALFENDGDGSPLRVLGTDREALNQHQFSQELHLLGNSFDEHLQWLAGLYYLKESAREETKAYVMPGIFQVLESLPVLIGPSGPIALCPPPAVVATLPTPGPLGCAGNPNNVPLDLDFAGTNSIETTNYAVFGQGTLQLNPAWSVVLGLRYTHERKRDGIFYQRINSGFIISPAGTELANSSSVLTPRAEIEFRPMQDVMTYISASRGFRSGGFNGRPFYREAVAPFNPEYVWSYELGAKTEWLQRRLIVNVAVFFNQYRDIQLTSNVATADGNVTVLTENGGDAEIKGAELEIHARPIEAVDVVASFGYADAKLTSIAQGATVTLNSQFTNTPRTNGSLGIQHTLNVSHGLTLLSRVNYAFRSGYFNDVANTPGLFQSAFGVLDARTALASEHLELAVFGTNLTDKRYVTGGVGAAAAIGFNEVQFARPRQWGATLTYRF